MGDARPWWSVDGRRTDAVLSDGRALRLYDDLPGRQHPVVDRRPPSPPASPGELRRDPLTGEWVVYSVHRQDRTHLPARHECPLCPSRAGADTEVPVDDYDVAVFDNRFPAFPAAATDGAVGGGRCEVVCFTADHHGRFSSLPADRVRTVAAALVDRTRSLTTQPDVEHVLVFENRGVEIGVTLEHPHAQIYAFPFVPQRVQRALDAARAHRTETDECLWCRTACDETRDGRRVVVSTELSVGYVPRAARWPYAVDVLPRRHVADLADLTAEEADDLLSCYQSVLRRVEALFPLPAPYIAAWHQAPARRDRDVAHLRAEVFTIRRAPDKLKYLAGCESTTDVFLNDVLPEDAAERLRALDG